MIIITNFLNKRGITEEMSHNQLKLDVERHVSFFDDHIPDLLNLLSVVHPSTEPCGFKLLSLHTC